MWDLHVNSCFLYNSQVLFIWAKYSLWIHCLAQIKILTVCLISYFISLRFFKMEEDRHKREMALQLEQAKLEAVRRREEREHELAVLQLLTRNAYLPATSIQSTSVVPGGYCPRVIDETGRRSFEWGHAFMGGVMDQSSCASSESSYTQL